MENFKNLGVGVLCFTIVGVVLSSIVNISFVHKKSPGKNDASGETKPAENTDQPTEEPV